MDALSSEWRVSLIYQVGDRVAFKLGDSLGVAAFECTHKHTSTFTNQPTAGGNYFWKLYPRGFPRVNVQHVKASLAWQADARSMQAYPTENTAPLYPCVDEDVEDPHPQSHGEGTQNSRSNMRGHNEATNDLPRSP
ncbi:hypothetical protein FA13DRAFT_1075410 [Coprinellus micaceus]|uniref:Uncharacterized protein n=1 Tax=Coprinellus micaceus TaxID=71717 RepID=A0A4Y7TRM7_COPMI|nr:hypothetical protein FA13DRAFT_1075410 [Coprinellus micaceus]